MPEEIKKKEKKEEGEEERGGRARAGNFRGRGKARAKIAKKLATLKRQEEAGIDKSFWR